jgi:eukaryotic-like serine/threonine-protein kinase
MATAGVNRMMLWTDLEGRELLGCWRLGSLVRSEGRTAWFAATADGKPLLLSITETLNDDEERLKWLTAAAEVRHANVVMVYGARAACVDDTPVVIAAMEATDENLDDVLRERTLQATEAQQVLRALVQGLAAIHARELLHGRMEPGSVLAAGETIKLRSDCLHPDDTEFALRAAEDVRGLGRIVTQAMTGRLPASENDPVLQLLPEPMARAVRRALSGNARIGEIAALAGVSIAPEARMPEQDAPVRVGPVAVPKPGPALEAVPALTPPAPAQAASVPANKPGEANAAEPAKPAEKIIAMKALEARSETPAERFGFPGTPEEADANLLDEDEPRGMRRRSAPLVIAVAVVLVMATVWALYGLLHRSSSGAQPQQAATTTATGQTQGQRNPASPAAQQAAAVPARRTGSATVAIATPGWRVIVYTYRYEAQAEHKAEVIRQRYPQLAPGVFALHGTAPYLVTLGGVMSRADAQARRDKAVQMGLPRDAYAQNYR